jgi:hypothetical protein
MHSFGKIFRKLKATRFVLELCNLIGTSQNAFIKKAMHENSIFVRGIVKEARQKKNPLLFLKLNFAKAFDCIHWEFLLESLHAFGFGPNWKQIISLVCPLPPQEFYLMAH